MKHAHFCIRCVECGSTTSKVYAQKHDGKCKRCAEPQGERVSREELNARYIDAGPQAWDDRD